MITTSKPTILVVDDQPINIKLLQRKLERQGMDVIVAYSGQECLDVIADTTPDLILLDIMMPEMDGIEVCQRLKGDPRTETIPIIFITAKASKEGKLEGLDAGAVDYITKPIDLDETLARVRTQLRLQEMFQMNLDLEERLGDSRRTAAIGAITQGIAHNLNNLLGVVVGYLDLIKNGYDSPDMVKRSVNLMDHAINRMVNIIRQLGTIAQNERIDLSPTPVNPLIESSIRRFKDDFQVGGEVDWKDPVADDVIIHANAETFEILVGKLLINAWEAYPKDTPEAERRIRLTTRIDDESQPPRLVLQVTDEGPGIDPEVADNLFEPFATTKSAVGRGMGLTIARHTMRNLDGEVRVENNSERGVTATLVHLLTPTVLK